MNKKKNSGHIIKSARLRVGLTQVELADKIGLHPNTIARIERDVQKPTFSTAKKLANALNLDIKEIPA